DGYISKPVAPQALIRTMEEVLSRTSAMPETPNRPPASTIGESRQPAAASAMDLDKLRRRLDGDEVTLHQLAQAMRIDLKQRLEQLRTALQQEDPDLAIAHAHGLKGSLGSMTAERGARLAKGLELAALARDWSLFGRALPLMQAEADQIDRVLASVLNGLRTSGG
ncbi:MAG: Hpt domain-containing protein, partial [Burkholderiaceae bacterium]